jgi:hypothetical protein
VGKVVDAVPMIVELGSSVVSRLDDGWIANLLHWLIQYWSPVDWIRVGTGVEWIIQWIPVGAKT